MKKSGMSIKKNINKQSILAKKYYESGKVDQAVALFKRILKDNPGDYEIWFNLGLIYQKMGDFLGAVNCYKKNIEYYAENPLALRNIALCYSLAGEKVKALEVAKTLAGKSRGWRSYFNLGATSSIAGEIREGISYFEKALKGNPGFPLTYGQLYNLYCRIYEWDKAKRLIPKIDAFNQSAIKKGGTPSELPFLNVSRVQNPKENYLIAKLKSDEIERVALGFRTKFLFEKKARRTKRIKIGYLSADFHDHATVHLILEMLNKHDRDNFEIFAYSYGVYDDSVFRRKVVSSVDHFKDISGLNDKEASVLIYSDAIDILVDLKGHTNGNRLGIIALKPSPISVTWLGFPGTTGANFIDYIIADKTLIPAKDRCYFTEKIIYLPDTYQVNNNKQTISKSKYKRSDFNLPNESFIFSSFNQAYKINKETFAVWMKILKRVPGSVLWLYEKFPQASKNLRLQAKKMRIEPNRLIFSTRFPKDKHLARISLSDLALDTFIYNGHTTTSDCLWAGVPVVTLKGSHFASRVSASLLSAVGLPELITHTPKEYENLAVTLAKSPNKLESLKDKLQKNRLQKPLFDTNRFTRNIEKAFGKVYKIYTSGGKTRQIMIE